MAKITKPTEIKKRKNLGEQPDGDTRKSVKKAIKEQAEWKRFPKPGKNKDSFPKSN